MGTEVFYSKIQTALHAAQTQQSTSFTGKLVWKNPTKLRKGNDLSTQSKNSPPDTLKQDAPQKCMWGENQGCRNTPIPQGSHTIHAVCFSQASHAQDIQNKHLDTLTQTESICNHTEVNFSSPVLSKRDNFVLASL